jgi:outer membrane translocation and assembly module TamA
VVSFVAQMLNSILYFTQHGNFRWIGISILALMSFHFAHAQASRPSVIQYNSPSISEPLIFRYDDRGIKKLDSLYHAELMLGYFLSHLDTIQEDTILKATHYKGPAILPTQISWTIDSIQFPYYPRSQHLIEGELKSWSNLSEEINAALQFGENNGYPFIRIKPIALVKLNEDNYRIQLGLEPGPFIQYDSLFVVGTQTLPVNYIRRYLGFKRGETYNESDLRQLDQRLLEIPFLEKIKSNEVRFWQDKADIKVYVKRKRANYFNAILGIRPNDQTDKVIITGDAEIRLNNAFNRGEGIELTWRKLQTLTQDLQVQLEVPYWFGSPIGTETSLKIYKRDTTFTDIKGRYGLLFQLERLNRISVFGERQEIRNLSTLNSSSNSFKSSTQKLYGLRLRWANLDYRFNPRRGFELDMEASAGRRRLTYTANDQANIEVNILKYSLLTSLYIPTWKKQTLRLSVLSQGISSDLLLDPELLRFGGLRTMRGIDEESINATNYGVIGLEYRWLFEQNGALYAFVDQGWYERAQETQYVYDTPMAFGVGVNFETKGGIFTFNYALGQQFANPLLVRNAKISFGFRNIF